MPSDALPVPFSDAAPDAPISVVGWTREWRDPLGRSITGTISLTRVGRPAYTVTADLVDGKVSLPLGPGTYRLVAALFDADDNRSYDSDMITVG
jgi:hypothetical protein